MLDFNETEKRNKRHMSSDMKSLHIRMERSSAENYPDPRIKAEHSSVANGPVIQSIAQGK